MLFDEPIDVPFSIPEFPLELRSIRAYQSLLNHTVLILEDRRTRIEQLLEDGSLLEGVEEALRVARGKIIIIVKNNLSTFSKLISVSSKGFKILYIYSFVRKLETTNREYVICQAFGPLLFLNWLMSKRHARKWRNIDAIAAVSLFRQQLRHQEAFRHSRLAAKFQLLDPHQQAPTKKQLQVEALPDYVNSWLQSAASRHTSWVITIFNNIKLFIILS
jgi:hypothetical protein